MENPFEIIIEQLNRIEEKLIQLNGTGVNGQYSFGVVNDLMTMEQAGEYLSVSKSHLYKLTSKREIPFIKRGKINYFMKKHIDEWLENYRITTKGEIEEMARDYLLKNPFNKRRK
jgi:excisionase family DNA binding protein